MSVTTCSSCKKVNRVPPEHLADRGKCGGCGAPFGPTEEPLDVDEVAFDRIIRGAKVPVLVDFWAAWCPPCRMAAPEVKKAARAVAGRGLVLKLDTERSPGIAARYNVQGIPNFIVFKDGRLIHQQAGLVDHRQMIRWLEEAAA